MTARHQLVAQRLEIVDLAIENDLYAAIFVAQRLVAGAQVDNGQAPVCKPDPESPARVSVSRKPSSSGPRCAMTPAMERSNSE